MPTLAGHWPGKVTKVGTSEVGCEVVVSRRRARVEREDSIFAVVG
jgi:hypothetical protein